MYCRSDELEGKKVGPQTRGDNAEGWEEKKRENGNRKRGWDGSKKPGSEGGEKDRTGERG